MVAVISTIILKPAPFELEDGAVTNRKIATDAVTSDKIADAAVSVMDIANDVITSAKIADGAVGTADIVDARSPQLT